MSQNVLYGKCNSVYGKQRFNVSGQHTGSSNERDLEQLIKPSAQMQGFVAEPCRQYKGFTSFERDPFKDLIKHEKRTFFP